MPIGSTAAWRYWFIKRGWPLWGSVGLFAVGLVVWFVAPHTQETVRRIGLFYEVLGIVAVLVELARTMRRHGLPWPWVRLIRYIRDIPVTQRVTHGRVEAALTNETAGAPGGLSVGANPSLLIVQRVEALERAVTAAFGEIARVDGRVTAEEQARISAIEREGNQRVHDVSRLTATIRETEVGNLSLSLFGLLWLLVGMVMTTGTEEVCAFFLYCAK